MRTKAISCLLAGALPSLAPAAAFAHAQLVKATPAVGSQTTSPSELRLEFSEGVEAKFSGATLKSDAGTQIPLGPPSVEPGDDRVLALKLLKPLPPGGYEVSWHAVATDTHHTQGRFGFTVKP